MKTDATRWDLKYRNVSVDFTPDPLLLGLSDRLQGPGRALDVACGAAQNTIWLAEQGFTAFGVDASRIGLERGMCEAQERDTNVRLFAADLDVYPLPTNYFDVIVVFRYLNRDLVPALKQALSVGGFMIYKTFNVRHLQINSSFNKNYVLQAGELREFFADFKTITTNDDDSPDDTQTYWVGIRPE